MNVLHTIDWLIIFAYFAIVLGIAWWVIKRQKDTSDEYFLAGRDLGWFVVGASILLPTSARSTWSAWPAPERPTA